MTDPADLEIPLAFDRMPPHSMRAEECYLGSLILAGGNRVEVANALALVGRDDFYRADNQIIYDAVRRLHEQGLAVDAVVVVEALKRMGLYEEVGGAAYVAQVIGTVPSYIHYPAYAAVIREKSIWRQAIAAANDLLREAYAPRAGRLVEEAGGVLSASAAALSRIAAGAKANEVHRVGDVAREILNRRENGEELRIPTGIRELDRLIGGLRKGGKTIIGAKPSMGKSSLIKQLARNIAGAGIRAGIITIEEDRYKVTENVLSAVSQVPNNRIAFGTAAEEEWDAIESAVDQIQAMPLFMVDSARKLSQILSMAHVLACQHHCEVIAVDHLHIVDGETDEKREGEIRKISGALKGAWKDLNVAGVEAAQLNRAGGRERPTLTSLRDSGSLEADGDVILLLHRDDYYARSEGKPLDGVLELIVAKNKDGAAGTVYTHFDEARQTIRDLNPEAEAPRPSDDPEFVDSAFA